MSRNNNRNNNGGGEKIPFEVEEFANASFKKHKKEYKDYFDSKKELRKDYFDQLAANLPNVIEWLLRNKHKPQEKIQNIKDKCYEKFAGENSEEFNAHLTKIVEKYGVEDIPNIELLPIILSEIVREILKHNATEKEKAESGEKDTADIVQGPDDLYKLINVINKKRLKKAVKKGIPEAVAFDMLTVMPVKHAAQYSAFYKVKELFDILYLYSDKEPLPFGMIIKFLFDKDDYKYVIGYALQERKDKYRTFNENQKKFFNDITSWCFVELEEMDKTDIRRILSDYIKIRKRDSAAGKDGNRRYYISSLPEKDYPTINEIVSELSRDPENKKYL